MNKYIAKGRLTADPELRQTQSGISSCRFTIAVDRKFKDKDTNERQDDFISCVAWRNTAEFISRYFSKGSMILIEGALRTGSYTDKNHSDVTHYTTDVIIENAEFCEGKKKESSSSASSSSPSGTDDFGDLSEFEEILSDEDVPF
jgi:single-strand DNA-binding protein